MDLKKGYLNFTSEEILLLVGIFKVLPWGWLKMLREYYDFNYSALRAKVSSAKKHGFLTIEKDPEGLEYLFLTKKGVEKINVIIPLNYQYKPWKNHRTDTIHRSHHRIVFHFLVDWLNYYGDKSNLGSRGHKKLPGDFSKYNIEEVYTDYDGQKCRYDIRINGFMLDIKPDLLLKSTKEINSVICLEATRNGNSKVLFGKILRYLMFASYNFDNIGLEKIKVYFSFESAALFKSSFVLSKDKKWSGLVYNHFNQGLRCEFLAEKIKEDISIRDIIKVLREGKIEIYAGLERGGFKDFEKIDLLKNIFTICDKLHKFGLIRDQEIQAR